VESAARVQVVILEYAMAAGVNRYELEQEVKRQAREG
jgi:hypothetical protein